MTVRATQPISSRFGSYMPGDEITEEAAGPVLGAWLAAGIAIEEADVAEDPKVETATAPRPEQETASRPERTTAPKRETATAPRQAPQAPHRRFVRDTEA